MESEQWPNKGSWLTVFEWRGWNPTQSLYIGRDYKKSNEIRIPQPEPISFQSVFNYVMVHVRVLFAPVTFVGVNFVRGSRSSQSIFHCPSQDSSQRENAKVVAFDEALEGVCFEVFMKIWGHAFRPSRLTLTNFGEYICHSPYHPCIVYLYTYIWLISMVNVGKNIIHGSFG